MCYNYSEDKEISNMETNNYKQLQRQLKCLAVTLLDAVNESKKDKYSAYEGLQEAMLKTGAIAVYQALEEVLNQSK